MGIGGLDDGAPHGYVTVEGRATVQRDNVIEAHKLILKVMRGPDAEPPEGYAERLEKERRLLDLLGGVDDEPGRQSEIEELQA